MSQTTHIELKPPMFLCEDCLTGSTYFTYICFWMSSWWRFWICNCSWFFLVNTISNSSSLIYDPLRAIVLSYISWLVHVSEISSHYRCHYIMLDMLRLVNVTNHIYWTRTKGLYIPCKLFVYSVYNSTVYNGVYTKQLKVD